jgi:hypothetical protein
MTIRGFLDLQKPGILGKATKDSLAIFIHIANSCCCAQGLILVCVFLQILSWLPGAGQVADNQAGAGATQALSRFGSRTYCDQSSPAFYPCVTGGIENVHTHSPRGAVSGCLYTARGPKLWVVMAIP